MTKAAATQTVLTPESVRLAWRRYLEKTRSATGEAYGLTEALAWQQLTNELNGAEGSIPLEQEAP
jgi:hypothetical protein